MSTNRWMRWQTWACSRTNRIANRAASLSSAPTRGSLILGWSCVPNAASVRASAGSLLLRCSRRLPKYLASSGLTTATG
jgi:hypothetical protein